MCQVINRRAPRFPTAVASARGRGGFTLVELLVSMVVLVLITVVTAQMVGKAMSLTSASNRQVDTASMSRTALDRIGADFSSAALTGGNTVLYYSGSPGSTIDPRSNSALGFLCKARSRKLVDGNANPGASQDAVLDARGTFVAYKIRPTTTVSTPKLSIQIPLISRGDAELTFSTSGTINGDKYDSSIWNLFGATSSRSMPADLMAAATSDTNLFDWQGFGDGVVRFHVSFILDDGRIVQSLRQPADPNAFPPAPALNATYLNFQANGGTGDCLPVAFSPATSADVNKRHVKGLLIGIAVLDEGTVNISYARDPNFIATLSDQIQRPQKDGETPVGYWQANLSKITSPLIRQNIRFYQRFYSANL